MNDLDEHIFREIKVALAIKGISLTDIANKLKRSRQQIWQISKGISKTKYIRRAISEAIGRDPWSEHGL